jgi:integrase
MRHTAATLWLAAGESPEWIARQLGHTSTQMLFKVYSRFVPNLTRQDGSAIDRLLTAALEIRKGESQLRRSGLTPE